jgi:hypothetical protein
MYRDIFTNKWILGSLGFVILFASACYLYYQYETAPLRQAERPERILQNKKQQNAAIANGIEQVVDAPVESSTPTTEKPTAELPRPGEIVDGRIFLGTEPPSPEFLSQLRTQDEIISPYGFGPYPELPEGYGPITWPRKNANSELMIRAEIELLNQGVPVEGIVMSNGLIYPIIKGICYVIWRETSDGLQYLHRSRGHPDDDVRSIADEKEARGETLTQADVPHIKLVPMEEGGIDPYTFLDLPK